MTDIVDRKTRSRMMAGIRGKDTKPEMIVRSFLHRQGLRFRLHQRNLPGRPDLVLRRFCTVIFVHGCFWHRHRNCRFSYMPASNRQFWLRKFADNVERDKKKTVKLRRLGWRVLVAWECALDEAHLMKLVTRIRTPH